jgi:hypothetical protein
MLNYADGNERKSRYSPAEKQWFQSPDIDFPLLNCLINDSNEVGPDNVLKDAKYNPLLNPFVSPFYITNLV